MPATTTAPTTTGSAKRATRARGAGLTRPSTRSSTRAAGPVALSAPIGLTPAERGDAIPAGAHLVWARLESAERVRIELRDELWVQRARQAEQKKTEQERERRRAKSDPATPERRRGRRASGSLSLVEDIAAREARETSALVLRLQNQLTALSQVGSDTLAMPLAPLFAVTNAQVSCPGAVPVAWVDETGVRYLPNLPQPSAAWLTTALGVAQGIPVPA